MYVYFDGGKILHRTKDKLKKAKIWALLVASNQSFKNTWIV